MNGEEEFAHLTYLKRQTIVRQGDEAEIEEAKKKIMEITGKTAARNKMQKWWERMQSKIQEEKKLVPQVPCIVPGPG